MGGSITFFGPVNLSMPGDLCLDPKDSFEIIPETTSNHPALSVEPFRSLDLGPLAISFQDGETRAAVVIRLITTWFVQMGERKRHGAVSDLVNEKVQQNGGPHVWPID